MKIQVVGVRNFRSLKSVALDKCAGVNVFIGKNNSGKSNILAAIDVAFDHIRCGSVTSDWPTRGRQTDEITDRDPKCLMQIGLQFEISEEQNKQIRDQLSANTVGMDAAIGGLEGEKHLSVVVAGSMYENRLARYIQEISLGSLDLRMERLSASGKKIVSVPDDVALELVELDRATKRMNGNIASLEKAMEELRQVPLFRSKERDTRELGYYLRGSVSDAQLIRTIEAAYSISENYEEFSKNIGLNINEIRENITKKLSEPTSENLQSFSGPVKTTPSYLIPILEIVASNKLIHFRETKQPIGSEEADQLLSLKTTRGGPDVLSAFQHTVKSLLGVNVDAFTADGPQREILRRPRSAEIDIDDFLVEANGAGVREALRIMLDLELKRPDFALIEEPEVHLHPGLEKVIHHYLVRKGETTQIFVATHSTNFLDVSERQNVYVVTRPDRRHSSVELAIREDEILKIPGELGLRPSSVFMFDRLLFVEGASDEAILVELAKKIGVDLTDKNVGVVVMGGGSNNRHFASDATIDLLSKRQIPMGFVLDRDERDAQEIENAARRLGDRAKIHWLNKREIENYLLVPSAVQKLINDKLARSGKTDTKPPTLEDVSKAISEEAKPLEDKVVKRMIARQLLKPIYPDRATGADEAEKVAAAIAELEERAKTLSAKIGEVAKSVHDRWDRDALSLASGSEVLTAVMKRYGLNYNKSSDAAKLAALLAVDDVDKELKGIIQSIGG